MFNDWLLKIMHFWRFEKPESYFGKFPVKCIFTYIIDKYGCITLILMKHLKKKLDGNYTKMPLAILNKSWKQHPTKQHLYNHLPPVSQTIQVRGARDAGHCNSTHGQTSVVNQQKNCIYLLSSDTGCCLENLPCAMANREGWWESKENPCCWHTLMMMLYWIFTLIFFELFSS